MKKTDPFVYIGGATRRRITKEQWEAAGVKGQEEVTWDVRNGKRCKVGDLTPEALDFLLLNHPGEFIVGEPTTEKMLDAIEAKRQLEEQQAAAPNGN